ncbi:MAG: hypothetical protein R3A44_41275 [Caldilineaceae bacterium]
MKQGEILERSQLEQLAKSALIEVILALQEQLVEQGKQIQKLSDQIAKHSQNSSKTTGQRWVEKTANAKLAQQRRETEWRTTRAPRGYAANGVRAR